MEVRTGSNMADKRFVVASCSMFHPQETDGFDYGQAVGYKGRNQRSCMGNGIACKETFHQVLEVQALLS